MIRVCVPNILKQAGRWLLSKCPVCPVVKDFDLVLGRQDTLATRLADTMRTALPTLPILRTLCYSVVLGVKGVNRRKTICGCSVSVFELTYLPIRKLVRHGGLVGLQAEQKHPPG